MKPIIVTDRIDETSYFAKVLCYQRNASPSINARTEDLAISTKTHGTFNLNINQMFRICTHRFCLLYYPLLVTFGCDSGVNLKITAESAADALTHAEFLRAVGEAVDFECC